MHFAIECPNDGGVDVTIEDVTSVVMRGSDVIEVVFECPLCGSGIVVVAKVPSLLAAAMEALDEDGDDEDRRLAGFLMIAQVDDEGIEFSAAEAEPDAEAPHIDAYCEYFHRELSSVRFADDILAEMDGSQKP